MNLPPFQGGVAPPTAVIDFDGTLSESHWPSNIAGPPIQEGVEALMHYFGQGLEIVIHTARPESHAPIIWAWLRENGLAHAVHDVVCGKPRGFVYIDDKAFNPFGLPSEAVPVTYMEAERPSDPFAEVDAARARRAPREQREEEALEAALERGRQKGARDAEPVEPRRDGRLARPVAREAAERGGYQKPPIQSGPANKKNRREPEWEDVG